MRGWSWEVVKRQHVWVLSCFSCVWLFATPRTVARQAPLSVGFWIWLLCKIYVKVKVLAALSCLTLCDPMNCCSPGSSVHGILQPRILEWVAFPFSRGYSQPRDRTQVSCIAGRHFNLWATRESNGIGSAHFSSPSLQQINFLWSSVEYNIDFAKI